MSICVKQSRGLRPKVASVSPKAPAPTQKQYKQTGPKYTGPNYKQADPSVQYSDEEK